MSTGTLWKVHNRTHREDQCHVGEMEGRQNDSQKEDEKNKLTDSPFAHFQPHGSASLVLGDFQFTVREKEDSIHFLCPDSQARERIHVKKQHSYRTCPLVGVCVYLCMGVCICTRTCVNERESA